MLSLRIYFFWLNVNMCWPIKGIVGDIYKVVQDENVMAKETFFLTKYEYRLADESNTE